MFIIVKDMTERAEDIKSNFFKRIEKHIFSKYDNVATVKRSASEKQEAIDDKIKKLNSVREKDSKVIGQFKVYKEDVDQYRRFRYLISTEIYGSFWVEVFWVSK